jgi:hypothetical protein
MGMRENHIFMDDVMNIDVENQLDLSRNKATMIRFSRLLIKRVKPDFFDRMLSLILPSRLSQKGLSGQFGSVVQWIEYKFPELRMQVRFLPGLPHKKGRYFPGLSF